MISGRVPRMVATFIASSPKRYDTRAASMKWTFHGEAGRGRDLKLTHTPFFSGQGSS
jgi:hypothetical protein